VLACTRETVEKVNKLNICDLTALRAQARNFKCPWCGCREHPMDPFANEDQEDLLEAEDKSKTWPFSRSNQTRRKTAAGFSAPLSWRWFVSVVGTEYCHTYFWIAKDLAWMQGLRDSSIFFGLLALGWSLVILYHALRTVNWHEIWNFVALFLWLFANFMYATTAGVLP
jgi:hypothetical protein